MATFIFDNLIDSLSELYFRAPYPARDSREAILPLTNANGMIAPRRIEHLHHRAWIVFHRGEANERSNFWQSAIVHQ
jgi:hypothetical protein